MSGVALLIPVLLWAITYPVLAAGIAAFVGGTYVLARIGARLVRESSGGETDETGEAGGAGGTSGRVAD
ncbi:hypothetical protein C449_02205 [Halococcus saccharolyticus DSM 5350]|uniref:Uncharacterized protein n=1 Tax=Halococcus saccharolyticus DSM 5350 TaxID=1227455 RepID=M0MNG3_9EURY|nr:hypothetical protein C449_02205 [Halococcus saccharolyticus DSM 5350]